MPPPVAKAMQCANLCVARFEIVAPRAMVRRTKRERSMTVRPRRSVLYMPGLNERALEKAKTLPADALILDLEDSVAPESKVAARDNVCEAVKGGGYGRRELVIRVNAIETAWGMDDLRAAASVEPDAILVPKVATPGDIVTVAKVLGAINAPAKVRLWAMMETPSSVLNSREIAALGADPENRLACLVMGTNDLLKESRARALHNRIAVVPWLAMIIVAARAYGLDILDGVYNDFRDETGFRDESEHGRTLGMDGKTLIHPSQVAPCNEVFSPTEEEVAWARKIIAAFEDPANARKGVITLEGKMVERLHLVMARRTVAIADGIEAMRRTQEEWF
jgi:citrate lyase subunit beta/citryl-CoA lyase